jgi:hypothetical protein
VPKQRWRERAIGWQWSSYRATTDSNGAASFNINVSGAILGDPVAVTVIVGNAGTSSARCSTSFVASTT